MTGLCPSRHFLSAPLSVPILLQTPTGCWSLQHQPPRCTDWPQWLLYFSIKEQPVYWVDSDTVLPASKDGRLVSQKSRRTTKKMSTFCVHISSFFFFFFDRRSQTWRRRLGVQVGSWFFFFKVLYFAGITPTKSASHTNFRRIWWQLESHPRLLAVSPPRPPHLLTVESFFAPDISHGWKAAGTRGGLAGWGEVSALARTARTSETSARTGRRRF